MPLPRSICDINHPPKISPLGFVSAGIAMVRITSSPFGFSGAGILSDHFITGHREQKPALLVALKFDQAEVKPNGSTMPLRNLGRHPFCQPPPSDDECSNWTLRYAPCWRDLSLALGMTEKIALWKIAPRFRS